jgi:hypothetical protein
MKFSIIHPTARVKPPYPSFPTGWRESMQTWLDRCDHPEDVEYVLSVHESLYADFCADVQEHGGWPGKPLWGWLKGQPVATLEHFGSLGPRLRDLPYSGKLWGKVTIVCDRGLQTSVSQGNAACKNSCGDILVGNEDDIFPPEHWDTVIWKAIAPFTVVPRVLHCSSGSSRDDQLFIPQILTRARYQKLGYRAHPTYESMYWDAEFSEHAGLDGVVIEARHIVFEHRHPSMQKAESDSVYEQENRKQAYADGLANLEYRRSLGFPKESESQKGKLAAKGKILAVCTPGKTFSAFWLWSYTELILACFKEGIGFAPFQSYTTNPYVTRYVLTKQVLECPVNVDYVLWIDDDNLVDWQHVTRLMKDLDEHPEAALVAGWCWIQSDMGDGSARSSVGRWVDGKMVSLTENELDDDELIEIDVSGFPCVLMRPELLKANGKGWIPDREDCVDHFPGEDIAFCLNAKKKGFRLFADGRVKVPHLKLRAIEPKRSTPNQSQPADLVPVQTLVGFNGKGVTESDLSQVKELLEGMALIPPERKGARPEGESV